MKTDGVTDGARTRDSQNHNLELYQLSYGHRLRQKRLEQQKGLSSARICLAKKQIPFTEADEMRANQSFPTRTDLCSQEQHP